MKLDYPKIVRPEDFDPETAQYFMLPRKTDFASMNSQGVEATRAGAGLVVAGATLAVGVAGAGLVAEPAGPAGVVGVAGALAGAGAAGVVAEGNYGYHFREGLKYGALSGAAIVAQAYMLPVSDGAKVAIGASLGVAGVGAEVINVFREERRNLQAAQRGVYSLVGANAGAVIENTLELPSFHGSANQVYDNLESRMLEVFSPARKFLPNFGRSSEDISLCEKEMERFYDSTAEYRN